MAKLSARGCHKVGQVQYDLPMEPDAEETPRPDRVTDSYITVALRSDGVILRKVTSTYRNTSIGTYSNGGAYSIVSRLKPGVPVTVETLERVAARWYGKRYTLRTGARH